jgi:hypothetical protein
MQMREKAKASLDPANLTVTRGRAGSTLNPDVISSDEGGVRIVGQGLAGRGEGLAGGFFGGERLSEGEGEGEDVPSWRSDLRLAFAGRAGQDAIRPQKTVDEFDSPTIFCG